MCRSLRVCTLIFFLSSCLPHWAQAQVWSDNLLRNWNAGLMLGASVDSAAGVNSTAAGGFYRGQIESVAAPMFGVFARSQVAAWPASAGLLRSSALSVGAIVDVAPGTGNFAGTGGGFPVQSPARLTQADFLGSLTWTTPLTNGMDFSVFGAAGIAAIWPAGTPTGRGGPEIIGEDAVAAFRIGIEISKAINEVARAGLQIAYQRTGPTRFRTTLDGENFEFRERDRVMATLTVSFNPPPVQPQAPPRSTSQREPQRPRQGENKPKQNELLKDKGPCKYGYGFYFGDTEANKQDPDGQVAANFAKTTGKTMESALKDGWGFGYVKNTYNGNVTRRSIDLAFDIVLDQIKDANKDEDCYIKFDFHGHGFRWKKGDNNEPAKTPKEHKDKDHIGFETGTGSGNAIEVYWDDDLAKQLIKISDALKKKGAGSALIVQADFCWSQGFFGELADKPRSNMHLAWSAGKDKVLCQKPIPEKPSPFAEGFAEAFAGGKKPSVDDAHKSATQTKSLKEFDPGYKSGTSTDAKPAK